MTATPAPVAPPAIAVHGLVRSFADQRVVDPWRSQPDRWLDDVLLYGAADEALARLGPDARPHSDRLFDLMVDSVSVERRIDHDARRPEPLGTDSVITRFKAGS